MLHPEQTCAEVHRGIQAVQRATCHLPVCVSISGEQQRFSSEVEAKQSPQVTHVVVVTGEVAPIFVLHLHTDDVSVVDIKPAFDFGEEDIEPLVNCLQVF